MGARHNSASISAKKESNLVYVLSTTKTISETEEIRIYLCLARLSFPPYCPTIGTILFQNPRRCLLNHLD